MDMKSLIPNRSVVSGFLAGVVALAAFAWFFGPKVNRHEEDPLTGRTRDTIEWLGATIYTHVEENEVSRWADQHSIKGIYPAQYGWSYVTTQHRRWFGRGSIGCGGYGIPIRIYRGEIKLDGVSKEGTLRKYQTALVENWKRSQSFLPVMEEWVRSARLKNSNASSEAR